MKKQEYMDLRNRHQREFDEFPIVYAFNDEQLKEALEKLGATKEECISVFGHGDIVRREDADKLIQLLDRQQDELIRRILDDEEFAEAAFLYEMDNHEYAINLEGDEAVLDSLGLTFKKINQWGLQRAYRNAREKHMKHAEEWGMI